jgi:hypothetical protein
VQMFFLYQKELHRYSCFVKDGSLFKPLVSNCIQCVVGCAKHIQFNPLRSEDVKLPDGAVFVIAHSLAVLNKAKTSDFNCRVAECRLASQVRY